MLKTPDYTHIRVYNTAKNLLITCVELSRHFNREYRYTIGQDLYKTIIDFILMIYDAYNTADFSLQYERIEKLKRRLQCINIYLRLCLGLHLFSKERYIELCKSTQDADDQLTGWMLSIKRKIKAVSGGNESAI